MYPCRVSDQWKIVPPTQLSTFSIKGLAMLHLAACWVSSCQAELKEFAATPIQD